ncbi:MAG: 1-phosphofructokinase family hexose kinase [Bryobacteraceae bacterium]
MIAQDSTLLGGHRQSAPGYTKKLIVTFTINPALDRTVSVDRLVFEDRAYIQSRSEDAGGRGINASRVIHSFGGKTLALLTAGGSTGTKIEKFLAKSGFPAEAMRIKNESRTNLTISDRQGLTIKLNEIGPPISADELKQLYHLVEAVIGKASWLMICGSLPPSVPPHFYCELITLARKRNVKTLLDTDGEALVHALEARPSVITPNHQEAERLLGAVLITRSQFLEAVDRIRAMGAESVILSLGSRGAIARDAHDTWEAIPPRVDALSPIGAGDAMAAAFVWAMDRKKTFADALRWGVGTGTASAKLPGMQFANLAQAKEIYKRVEVTALGAR